MHTNNQNSIKYKYKGYDLIVKELGIKNLSVVNGFNSSSFISASFFKKNPKSKKVFYVVNCFKESTESEINKLLIELRIIAINNYKSNTLYLLFCLLLQKLNIRNVFDDKKENTNEKKMIKEVKENIKNGNHIIYEDECFIFLNADNMSFSFPYPITSLLKIGDPVLFYENGKVIELFVDEKGITSFSSISSEYICYSLSNKNEKVNKFVYLDENLAIRELSAFPDLIPISKGSYFSEKLFSYIKNLCS